MDELMNDPEFENESFDVFFQFDEDEPIQLASIFDGHKFSLTLNSSENENPTIEFSNGKGKSFKLFMKKCS